MERGFIARDSRLGSVGVSPQAHRGIGDFAIPVFAGMALLILSRYGDGSFAAPSRPLPAVIRRLSAFMYALALATIMSVSEPRPR